MFAKMASNTSIHTKLRIVGCYKNTLKQVFLI